MRPCEMESVNLKPSPRGVGLSRRVDLAVLAVAARLLLVLVVAFRRLHDGFLQRQLRRMGDDLDVELALEPRQDDFHVELRPPGDDELARSRIAREVERGVGVGHLVHRFRHARQVLLGLRLHRLGDHRERKLELGILDEFQGVADRVAGVQLVHLRHADDVPRDGGGHRPLVLPEGLEHRADAAALPHPLVEERLVRGQRARVDPDVGQPMDHRVRDGLEDLARKRAAGNALDLGLLLGSVPFFGGASSGEGRKRATNSMNSATPMSFFAEVKTIGMSRPWAKALGSTPASSSAVTVFPSRYSSMSLSSASMSFSRASEARSLSSAGAPSGFVIRLTTPFRESPSPIGSMTGTQSLPKVSRIDATSSANLMLSWVHLVDRDDAGDAGLLGEIPGFARVDADPVDGVHADDRGFDGVEAADGLADEVGISGGVQEVDLAALDVHGGDGQVDRVLPLLLLGLVVEGAGAVLHGPEAARRLGFEQHGFGE